MAKDIHGLQLHHSCSSTSCP